MKVRRVTLLTLMSIFIFYGIASGEGGGPGLTCPDRCKNLPAPTAGPFLEGFFTIYLEEGGNWFDVHAVLTQKIPLDPKLPIKIRQTATHLFYGKIGPKKAPDICDRTHEDLLKEYKGFACCLEVEKAFNLQGTPVVTELLVKESEFCNDPSGKRMIYGTIKIRVVPDKPMK